MLKYEDIRVGDTAEFSKTICESDINQFAGLTGDFNPVHIDQSFAEKSVFNGRIAHGMLTGSFISTVLGMKLPGPNSIYLAQNLSFKAPTRIGDTVKAKVEVISKRDDKHIIKLKTQVVNQREELLIDGEAVIMKNQ